MPEEKIFKSAVDFKTHLKQMFFLDIIVGVCLVALLVILMMPMNTVLFLLAIFFGMASFILILAIILSFFLTRKMVKINKKGIQIPVSGFKGYFFREQTGQGYNWDMKGKTILISSSFANIQKAWKVTDIKEQKKIETNRASYNINSTVEIGGLKVRIKEIPSLLEGISDNTLANSYRKVIKEAFIYNHAYIPQKAVAIQFKEMKLWLPDEDLNSWTKQIAEKFKKIMPKFQNIVLYVSVDNPDELVREINSRLY